MKCSLSVSPLLTVNSVLREGGGGDNFVSEGTSWEGRHKY